ncbi:WD domain, G-beta repeat-containing protein [Entamoeba nuttalli P19]|uniref:WD domain, G-beta repeat-containing protein n=2 Tax=Entamoeba nuttalli TaxID=412467 RepID=K2HZR0_ENTNP|nr:WD domain, G-beta repeat-containing protein [Entamoeba nuttalli P19]EKE41945.1 WD domain, G-beta repeat-containing protein [Entamoeba nuttalli P19]|eukprot:XP_008855719.1 WD domain, G-beta repeat-containing protein [Entamoeba nuttalli P19]
MAILDYYYSTECIIPIPTSFLKTLPIENKTKIQPFSELYAILTSIIEAIAWNVLPAELFMKLFRQDIAVASLFRHFILACRIMKKFNYKPQSFPELPDTSNHLLWKTWDSVLELAIPKLINSTRQINYLPSPFFNNLIISLKTWLSIHPDKPSKPCILPMIFRLFLRKDYTYEVFGLICEYVDLGFFACDRVVNIGFIPLLVQSLEKEGLEEFGVFCLAKIFSYDSSLISHYLRGSIRTLIRIVQKGENPKESICGLFLLAQIFGDGEVMKQIDTKGLYNIFIGTSRRENWLIKVWSMVCLARLIEQETTKRGIYENPQIQGMIIELTKDKRPLVRSSVIYLIMHGIPQARSEETQEILNGLQGIIFELAKDGCPTVRSLLVVLIFKIMSKGYNGNKYQEVLEYLANDPDPDVIRASEGLITLNEKIKGTRINMRKQMASPLEQFIKTSKKIFDDLIERFYCSIRDIFRKPLLIEVINENKRAKKEWFEKQSIATQSSCRDLYIDIPNREMKEESKLTIINNMYIPKKVIFHPTLPVILTDVGNDSIGIYEYKVSPFPTKTFSNFNAINTSINFIDWMNKSDSLLISGCEDGSIRIWGDWSNEHKSVSSWRGIPNQGISKARFSTLTNNRICVGADYSICVWDAELEECINTFKIEETVSCLSPFSDKSFFCGGSNGTVNIIDIRCKNISQWKEQKREIVNVGYSTRSFTVVTTSKGETSEVCLYDIRKISENQSCKAYKTIDIPEITSACVHEEAPYFAIGTTNNYVQLYNVITGTKYQELKSYENIFRFKSYPVNSVCFPDYDFSLAVTTNTNIIIYSLN